MRRFSWAAVAVAGLAVAGCGGPAQQAAPAGALADAVNQRAAKATSEHESGMNCVARAFGLDPAGATEIPAVKTVYAWVYCHAKDSDSSELLPVAVTLSGQPEVRIPGDGADWSRDIDRIFPADVRDAVYDQPKSVRDLVASLPDGPPPN